MLFGCICAESNSICYSKQTGGLMDFIVPALCEGYEIVFTTIPQPRDPFTRNQAC